MTENNKELKACPFCGGEPLYEFNSEDDKIIVCQRCGAGAAPSVWNARHNEAPTGEIGELIERINERLAWYPPYKVVHGVLTDCKAQLQQAQKMREALEYYANNKHWYEGLECMGSNVILRECGDVARQALNKG